MNGLKIGTIVDYHSEIGGPITRKNCIIRSAPWQLGSGEWVINISGMAGGVSLDSLSFPDMPDTKPDCLNCTYVRSIPGDIHISCVNLKANVEGADIGVRNGYFDWPYNFDPRWLVKCDGYVKRGD